MPFDHQTGRLDGGNGWSTAGFRPPPVYPTNYAAWANGYLQPGITSAEKRAVIESTLAAGAMGDDDGVIRWYTANPRGVLPLDTFHVPRTLRQVVNQQRFQIKINTAFSSVMRQCMNTRPSSWINDQLISAYDALHKIGYAHSVECWLGDNLVGGLYGVSLGAAFFGESMFHHVRDASKVALVHLVARLVERHYELLDTQATTDHLRRFGCIDVPADQYLAALQKAITKPRQFAD